MAGRTLVETLKHLVPLPRSIRWRLFWLLGGVSLGSVLIVIAIWLPAEISQIGHSAKELQRVSVQSIQRQVGHFVLEIEQHLSKATRQFHVAAIEGDQDALRSIGQRLLQQHPAFEEVGLVDPQGKETFKLSRRLATVEHELRDHSGTAFFREGLQNPVHWSRVRIKDASEPWVTVTMRFPSSAAQVPGIMYGNVNLRVLWQQVEDLKLTTEGRAYVVDREGRLIAGSDRSLVLRQLSFAERPPIKELIFSKDPQKVSFVHGYYTNELGTEVSATGMWLTGPRWGIFIEQPLVILYASILRAVWFFLGLSVAGVLVSFGVANFISIKVSEPIMRLRQGADRIAGGHLKYRVPVETADEVGDLARQFNRMTEALQASYAGLEEKVAARTRELSALYTALTPLAGAEAMPKRFDYMLQKLISVTGADAASIRVIDHNTGVYTYVAKVGFEPGHIAVLPRVRVPESPDEIIFAERKPIISGDIGADDRIKRKRQVEFGFKSAAFLPLVVQSEVCGIIHLASRNLGYFTDEKQEYLMMIARLMGIVVDNHQLLQSSIKYAEDLNRSNQKLSAFYTALAPIGADVQVQELLAGVIERLQTATGADASSIRMLDENDGSWHYPAQKGFPQEYISVNRSVKSDRVDASVFTSGEPIVVENIAADARIKRKKQLQYGFNSCAFLPLKVRDEVCGVVHLASRQAGYFSEDKKEYLMAIVRLMGIVIENNELLQSSLRSAAELQRANLELSALYAALAPIGSDVQVEELLAGIIERLKLATGADAALIRVLNEEKTSFRCLAQSGFASEYVAGLRSVSEGTSTCQVMTRGEPILSPDLSSDPLRNRKRQLLFGFASYALLPLVVRGNVSGVIQLASTTLGYFHEGKREYLMAIARLVGIVMENNELLQSLIRTAEDLKRSNMELEQFAYVASHDLQEPLRMITGYTQLLAKRYKGKLDQNADEFIGFVVDGAKRMQTLINDLLTFSRVGTRGKELAPTDCADVLEKTLAGLRLAIQESGAVVTNDPLPVVMGDEMQLGQLFQNLIGNSIKYRDHNPPEIHVSCQKEDQLWRFSVRDNGIGINPQDAGRIFQIFQRLHTREEYSGTGIGLAVCRKIVERHDGTIWVESQVGQGATFYFTLPASLPEGGRGNDDRRQ